MQVQLFEIFGLVVEKGALKILVQLLFEFGFQPPGWRDRRKARAGSGVEILGLWKARQVAQLAMSGSAHRITAGCSDVSPGECPANSEDMYMVAGAVGVARREPRQTVRVDPDRPQGCGCDLQPDLPVCTQCGW
jgi:hypothetical protein